MDEYETFIKFYQRTGQSSLTRLALTFPPAVGQVYSSAIYQNDFGLS